MHLPFLILREACRIERATTISKRTGAAVEHGFVMHEASDGLWRA